MTGTNATSTSQGVSCLECGGKGTKVERVTLESLLTPDAALRIGEGQYGFCDAVDCETVYFGDRGTTFATSDLTVRVGVKERTSPRHVCYCFDHTIEEIEAEVEETGRSTVLDDIKARMETACWCETKSPQGSCCLGTVGKYVEQAMADHGNGDAADKNQRTGRLAVGGSVLSALAASACCWMPLLLIAFGVSAGGVSAWFEQYRWLFLGLTAILLGTGFYFVYFRTQRCAPASACATPSRRMQRSNRVMLWMATIIVVATAAFPKYVGSLIPEDTPVVTPAPAAGLTTASMGIEGMTCEACAIHVKNALAKVPGVLDASVSYADRIATVTFDESEPPSSPLLANAVEGVGYKIMGARSQRLLLRPADGRAHSLTRSVK